MIHTRLSIFESLKKKLHLLLRYGRTDSTGFKNILYSVILNDLKEWSEYKDDSRSNLIVDILNNFIIHNKDFVVKTFVEDESIYVNVNTPQDNTTWSRVWDNSNYKSINNLTEDEDDFIRLSDCVVIETVKVLNQDNCSSDVILFIQ